MGDPEIVERVEQPAEQPVRDDDLAVVPRHVLPLLERREPVDGEPSVEVDRLRDGRKLVLVRQKPEGVPGRWIVGPVRFEEVEKEEKLALVGDLPAEPLESRFRRFDALSPGAGARRSECVVVGGEPAIEAGMALQGPTADEPSGGVAPGGEDLGQSGHIGGEAHPVAANPVAPGIPSGEDGSVGGGGGDVNGDRLVEDHAPVGEPVEVGARRARIAVDAEVVRSERVDAQDDEVDRFGRRGGAGCGAARRNRDREQDGDDPHGSIVPTRWLVRGGCRQVSPRRG